jgi:hypothetical protein
MGEGDRDLTFRIRPTAERRNRTSFGALPQLVTVHADGSAVVAFANGDQLTRYESIVDCLAAHGLVGGDLEPID